MRLQNLPIASMFVITVGLFTSSLWAGPVVVNPPGGPWYEFGFGGVGAPATAGTGTTPSSGGNSIFADQPAWTFNGPLVLTVTDAFNKGDSFDIFDFGAFAFATPLVSAVSNATSDPSITVLDPTWSHASLAFGAGPHSITISPNASPFGGGAGYFRLDVPEPASCALFGLGAVALFGFAARKRWLKRAEH